MYNACWRCGVRHAEERFDGFEKFVAVQRQHQPLQPPVPRLYDPLAEARVFVQIHRGTVEEAHQQKGHGSTRTHYRSTAPLPPVVRIAPHKRNCYKSSGNKLPIVLLSPHTQPADMLSKGRGNTAGSHRWDISRN
uniref:Uncharacterized protein n=1 Tax=Anopheles farauti TaxID=69004 RepID=A0A182QL30_9DIPT